MILQNMENYYMEVRKVFRKNMSRVLSFLSSDGYQSRILFSLSILMITRTCMVEITKHSKSLTIAIIIRCLFYCKFWYMYNEFLAWWHIQTIFLSTSSIKTKEQKEMPELLPEIEEKIRTIESGKAIGKKYTPRRIHKTYQESFRRITI